MCNPAKAFDRAFGTDVSGEGAAASAANNAKLASDSAQEQRDAEARRQANIAAGKHSIDSAFGTFDDNYFNKYRDAQVGALVPQIQDQYATAQDKLYANLVDRGVDRSTIAGGYYNQLEKTKGAAEGNAAASASDAVSALRNSIQTQKNNLYSLNSTGADPSTIATQAIGSATALAPNQNTTSLGNLFADVLSPVSKAVTAYNYSPYVGSTPGFNFARNGNAKVVA
jgi:hypothetical protein